MVMILCCHFNQYFLLCLSVKPVVKVTPDQRVFRGERVTLTCDIQRAEHIQWRYSWFKGGSVIRTSPRESTASHQMSLTAVNTAVKHRDQRPLLLFL